MLSLPDPTEVRTLADLAELLRALRRREARARPGRQLSYQQIAERAGSSAAIVGYYLAGSVLPPADRFDTLVQALGASPTEFSALASARDRVADARRSPAPGTTTSADFTPVPRELPAAPSHFIGRDVELAQLEIQLCGDGSFPGPRLAVVTGMGGVGKSALALRWAHRAAERFPDGQLFVDLRGYDSVAPVDPADALTWILHSLGVSPDQVPRDPMRCAARFRTLTAGRRLLILLDNARSAEQVRPLLPGHPLCTVVVTSRDSLSGLVAGAGASRIALDPLSGQDATRLLHRLAGEAGGVSPAVLAALRELCAGLPLAIRVAAEAVAHRPTSELAALADELRAGTARLDALDLGDPRTAVRTVLSWSYRLLSSAAARLLRQLARAPAEALTTSTVAALGGLDRPGARRLLAELTRAHLLTEATPGRYTIHALLRDYAVEQAFREAEPASGNESISVHFGVEPMLTR